MYETISIFIIHGHACLIQITWQSMQFSGHFTQKKNFNLMVALESHSHGNQSLNPMVAEPKGLSITKKTY